MSATAVDLARLEGEVNLLKGFAEGGKEQTIRRWTEDDARFSDLDERITTLRVEFTESREESRTAIASVAAKLELGAAVTNGKIDATHAAMVALTETVAGQTNWAQTFKDKPWPFLAALAIIVAAYLFSAGHIGSLGTDILGNTVSVSAAELAPIDPDIESDGTD